MPARITIKAELQNLLNKAQALTDANRLSQLEGERRRRAEREQLAAKKVKAEEDERRRRALDDPTMRNIRTAAMGQQSGPAFALIPTVPIDFSLKGPYGESIFEPDFESLPEKQAGIYGLSRGYANTLWGVNRKLIGLPFSTNDLPSPVLETGGGLYGPKATKYDTVGVLDETGYFEVPRTSEAGGFIIRHLVAEGTDIRWYDNGEGTLLLANQSIPVGINNFSDSATLEVLVRIGAAPPFSGSGESSVTFTLVSIQEDQSRTTYNIGLFSRQNECFYVSGFSNRPVKQDFFPSSLGGQLIHVAIVQRRTQFSIYIAGARVHVFDQNVNPPSRKRTMEVSLSANDYASKLQPSRAVIVGLFGTATLIPEKILR